MVERDEYDGADFRADRHRRKKCPSNKVMVIYGKVGKNKDGKNATAGFISGLMKAVPPLSDVFDQAGMELPELLGKKKEESEPAAEE